MANHALLAGSSRNAPLQASPTGTGTQGRPATWGGTDHLTKQTGRDPHIIRERPPSGSAAGCPAATISPN